MHVAIRRDGRVWSGGGAMETVGVQDEVWQEETVPQELSCKFRPCSGEGCGKRRLAGGESVWKW